MAVRDDEVVRFCCLDGSAWEITSTRRDFLDLIAVAVATDPSQEWELR
jgi:hypothetical protein